jgi:RNA polymerase-binding protein DksA
MSNLDAPVENTPYSDEELEYFRNLLLEERQNTKTEIDRMKEVLDDQRSLDDDRASSQAHHPGDIGSEEGEKETDYILSDRQRKKLKEIDAALERIKNKTYGICEATGKKIQKERLEAIPYARLSAEASQQGSPDHPGPIGKKSRQ